MSPGLSAGSSFDVIVAGAGVGGGAAALAFARQGLRVLVLEMRPGPGNINRGTSLLPAVTRHLRAWGVLERFYEAGAVPMPGMQVFHHRRGLLLEAPFLDTGHPYLVLDHPEIERVFAEEGERTGLVSVRYSTRVTGLVREDGRLDAEPDSLRRSRGQCWEGSGGAPPRAGRVCGVEVVGANGAEGRFQGRLVVGADGSASAVRRLLGLELPAKPYDTCYYGINFERPRGYRDGMRLHLHPEGGLMLVPNRPGVVGAAVLVRAEDKELFRTGPLEARVAAIRRRAEILRDCAPLARNAHLYPLSRAHAPEYGRDGAVLIGDAVHLTHPTGGQGMTMAIEDAAELAAAVGPLVAKGARDAVLDHGLAAYQRRRRPLNAGLLRWSHGMGTCFGYPGPVADFLRRSAFAFCATPLGRSIQPRVWKRMGNRAPAAGDAVMPPPPALASPNAGSRSLW